MSLINKFVAAAVALTSPVNSQNVNGQRLCCILNINIFGTDDRVMQSATGNGAVFAPIGMVEMTHIFKSGGVTYSWDYQATGFLVSPCLMVTSYNAVFGNANTDVAGGQHLVKFKYFNAEDSDYQSVNARPVLHGTNPFGRNFGEDWAISKLDQCVGEKTGWMEIDHQPRNVPAGRLKAFYHTLLAGFPSDKHVEFLWIDPDCDVIDTMAQEVTTTGGLATDCAALKGNEGSPIMEIIDGVPKVLGIFSYESVFSEYSKDYNKDTHTAENYGYSTENFAADIEAVYAKAGKMIVDDIHGRPNPALKNRPFIRPALRNDTPQ